MRPQDVSTATPEILTLTITDIARAGAGVARDEGGRVIFVPYTAPGDRVRVRITSVEKRYAQGELVELLEAGPARVKAKCEAFTRCGGCQWQHLAYEHQWKIKSSGVRYALERMQVGLPQELKDQWDEFPAEKIWEYRNRVQLRGKGTSMGFFTAGTNDLVSVTRCEIARPEILADWESIRREGERRDRPYKVEVEVLDDKTLRHTWNSAHGASGFRQVHDEQNTKLKNWVFDRLKTQGGEPPRVIDLYGGSGNLSLALSQSGSQVECVDTGSPTSPPPGTPSGMRFHRASVLSWLLRRAQSGEKANQAILDPPREGLGQDFHEMVRCLEAIGVTELIAVGCDPDGWARDVSRYLKRGWTWQRAAVLDFFPQTPHVESAGYFTRTPV